MGFHHRQALAPLIAWAASRSITVPERTPPREGVSRGTPNLPSCHAGIKTLTAKLHPHEQGDKMNRREYDTRGCAFTRIATDPALDADDHHAIDGLLNSGQGHHAIAIALQDAGINISTKTVERHRRNICTCEKSAAWVL